jgi:NADPH2:quinone reductase
VRAAQVVEVGKPPQPVELPEPADATVTIAAVALNPVDIAVGSGSFYGGHPPLPYVPGCEAAGRADDGTLVYLFGDGRGISQDGFLMERVSVPASLPLELPETVDPAVAAALGIAGIAAWVPVAWKAKVGPEDRVLVLGASGTVGRIAVQAARILGATNVVGASRRGGDGLVRLDEIGQAFPDGFTVCIDPVWGEPLAHALQSAAPGARVVHVGQAAGPEAPLRSADVRGKELQILGHSNFALSAGDRNRAYLELLAHVLEGSIVIDIETHALDDVAPAWERQQAGAKVVITLG